MLINSVKSLPFSNMQFNMKPYTPAKWGSTMPIHESKVTQHRGRMRAAGLRPVQFWVPDTRSPDFSAEVRKQCQSLKSDPGEADVLRFAEEAASHVEGWQ